MKIYLGVVVDADVGDSWCRGVAIIDMKLLISYLKYKFKAIGSLLKVRMKHI